VLAGLLAAGAMAVALAGVSSGLFDLDRHAVPKELALHLTALLGVPLLAWSIPAVRLTIPTWLISAWLGWSALSTIFATNHWLAWRALGVSTSGAIVFWMAGRAARGGFGRLVLGGLGCAAVAAAITGVAQAHGLEFALLAESRAPGGTLGNRNFLAHLSAMALPILLLATLGARRVGALATALSGLVVLSTLITLTRSRAAWLAATLAVTCFGLAVLLARRADRPVAPPGRGRLAVLALAVGVLAALVIPNQLEWRSGSPYRDTLGGLVNFQDGSGRGRVIQYRNTLDLVRRSPVFGVGPGNWAVEYPSVTTPGDPSFAAAAPIPTNPWPSSDWVTMLAERGPVGALLLLLAGLTIGVSALRRLRDPDPARARGSATLVGLLVATVIAGMFDAVLLLAPPTLFFWATAGALLPDAGPVLDRPVSRRTGLLLFTLLVGLVTSFTGRSAMQLAAIRVAGNGRTLLAVQRAALVDPGNFRLQLILATRLRCARAIPHAVQALRLFPNHPSARRASARCGRGVRL
jgi:O-antigen ligase